jgi:hypothetical protein
MVASSNPAPATRVCPQLGICLCRCSGTKVATGCGCKCRLTWGYGVSFLRIVRPDVLGGESFASEESYRWFGANQVPLPGSLVWIGRYEGEGQWPISFHHDPLASGGSDLQRKLIWPTRGDPVWWPPAHSYKSTDELQEASRLAPGGPAAPLPRAQES